MTLNQKREIVTRFKNGETICALAFHYCASRYDRQLTIGMVCAVEPVLRNYMLGKFRLEKRRPKQ